mmetsp:Transcript_4597/g.11523  ORF Transcript_4597/g.11523 Transcript_4597/m.11523 type:complete len:281 (+) Transcript_4597:84-926(+)
MDDLLRATRPPSSLHFAAGVGTAAAVAAPDDMSQRRASSARCALEVAAPIHRPLELGARPLPLGGEALQHRRLRHVPLVGARRHIDEAARLLTSRDHVAHVLRQLAHVRLREEPPALRQLPADRRHQRRLHHAPLLVPRLAPRVGELNRDGGEGAARRAQQQQPLEVDVGVAREEVGVAQAVRRRVGGGGGGELWPDLEAEEVGVRRGVGGVEAEDAARAADVDVERERGVGEERGGPVGREGEKRLVRALQRVDVVADLLVGADGAAALVGAEAGACGG